MTATGWELLSNLFLCVYWNRTKCDIPAVFSVLQTEECVGGELGTGLEGGGDIHEEVEADAGLYGVDSCDCWGIIGGVRVEEVGTAYCRGHYSRT